MDKKGYFWVCVAAVPLIGTLWLSACRSHDSASADKQIVWNNKGCAFWIEPNVGDTSFIRPMPDANKPSCTDK